MEAEHKQDKQEEKEEKQNEGADWDRKAGKDFWDKIFESSGQDEDKKNIYVQYRIINNHGIMANDNSQIEQINMDGQAEPEEKHKKAKRNVFSGENKRNRWLSENYETYSMALMIAVAVFDAMPYMWVRQAADILYDAFAKKSEEDRRYGITEALSQFGATITKGELNTYTGVTPTDIVSLEQKSLQKTILKYVWIECPQLQDIIMDWLEKQYGKKPMAMSKRTGEVMGWLACWDYHYFLNNMVSKIRHRNDISTDLMIAQIVTILDKKSEFQDNVLNLLRNWSKEQNLHYLLTGLFVCAGQTDKNDILEAIISCYIGRAMKELQKEQFGEYLQTTDDFFAAGMRAFAFYRILIEKIDELRNEDSSPRNQRNISRLFWGLFGSDIKQARYKEGEDAIFIRIAMQENPTGEKMRKLWQMVWRDRGNREIFYFFLSEYEKKACQMKGHSLERFIQKTFGNVCEEKWLIDICGKIQRRSGNE